jgi:hypothetical protein
MPHRVTQERVMPDYLTAVRSDAVKRIARSAVIAGAVLTIGPGLISNAAFAACNKDDRSGCDLPQSVAHKALDGADRMNEYTPPPVRPRVQGVIDDARKSIGDDTDDQ